MPTLELRARRGRPRGHRLGRVVNASAPGERRATRRGRWPRSWAGKNPVVLYAKLEQSHFLDAERGPEQGLTQFLDEKRIRPGLQQYER